MLAAIGPTLYVAAVKNGQIQLLSLNNDYSINFIR